MLVAHNILDFWFSELSPAQWYRVDPALDADMRARFGDVLETAKEGGLGEWREDANGRLAEIIVLDQFSRNIHRGTPLAFAADPLALQLAVEAVAHGALSVIEPPRLSFLLLPFMHSESPAVHEKAVELYGRQGLEGGLEYELKHKAIIDRFGRYPHRNEILGRTSTAEERAFLKQPGSSF